MAFLRLAKALKPAIENALCPPPPALFPHVCFRWPAERGPNGWFQQFQLFAKRLRQKARSPGCPWWRVEQWLAQPVMRARLEASVGKLLAVAGAWQQPAARARLPAHRRVRWSAKRFCWRCGPERFCPPPPFWTRVAGMAGLGHGARLPGARSQRSAYMFRGGVGSLASLAAPAKLRGKVVTVVGMKRVLDDVVLEATLATLPEFAAPCEDGAHCYHVVHLIRRVRLLRAVESCCGRWGSIIHLLWDGNSIWHPRRVAGRLLLRDSGLMELSSASEGMVTEITDFLSKQGMDPFVQNRRLREAVPLDPPLAGWREACRRALRESSYTRELAAEAARPCSLRLRPDAEEALAKARRVGGAGDFAPLPLFHENAPTLRRDRATSVLREAQQDWWQGPEAAEWREKRVAIFGTGEGPAIPALSALDKAEDEGTGGAEGSAGDA